MSQQYRHPDEVGGGVFLFLIILGALYSYFIIYDAAGNFKTCDVEKYPYALVCLPVEKVK